MPDTGKGADRCCIDAFLMREPADVRAPQWTLPALPAEVIYIDAAMLNRLRDAYYCVLGEIAVKCSP
jgi:hypothetical protein